MTRWSAPELLRSLDAENEVFMADVHSDQHLYLSDPAEPCLPAAKTGRGRKPSHYHSDQTSMTVSAWAKQQSDEQ
ncbi:MAG: hypothetical protein GXP08_08455 [Gammaproteobacteria bacterium]|nr:hypothetical protein [Gammaproteobacteria bacterium]